MESDCTKDDDALLSKLQSPGEFTGIYELFIAHLRPFTLLETSKCPDADDVRTLSKRFLNFIDKSLYLISKRLSESKLSQNYMLELFKCYRLCLYHFRVIVPELSSIIIYHEQCVQYLHCLVEWGRYTEAENKGFELLARMEGKSKTQLVPELNEETVDPELVYLICEIVVTLVECASEIRSKSDTYYLRIISLVNQSKPWFKKLDVADYEKFHSVMVSILFRIALFLVAEIKSFDKGLIWKFSLITFEMVKISQCHDKIYQTAEEICSTLFSQKDEQFRDDIFYVLKHVMNFMAAECKDAQGKTTLRFLDLVCYCAKECKSATVGLCELVAEHLNQSAVAFHKEFPLMSSILRLYAGGLLAISSNQPKDIENCSNAQIRSGIQVLLKYKERFRKMADSIKFLKGHLNIVDKVTISLEKGSPHSAYWEALNFLCRSLVDSIFYNPLEIFSEAVSASSLEDIGCIHDAFEQFCHIILQCLSSTEKKRMESGDNHSVISMVVVAALALSFKTNKNIKESLLMVQHVISAACVPYKRLRILANSLCDIAVKLYQKKQLKKAIEALKLCCKASWNFVFEFSQLCNDGALEKYLADFVACASHRTALLLELNQDGNSEIKEIVKESFACWSFSENLITKLPTPVPLVKMWVKIQYKLPKESEDDGVLLYSLLSSSQNISIKAHGRLLEEVLLPQNISIKALGRLLEEELLAYDESCCRNPRFCFKMKMELIRILLEVVYVTEDSALKKGRVLIEKAKSLRTNGSSIVDECIPSLSEAISFLKSIYDTRTSCSSQVHHLLIHAYMLQALWTKDAPPDSKLSPKSGFQDAFDLCLEPDHGHADEQNEGILYCLYEVIDFLSIKGNLGIHSMLYKVLIAFFKKRNFSLAKTLAELWKNKRLSHALCASPVNDIAVESFSKHQSQLCKSSKFWEMCLRELKPLVVGFQHTNDEIKQAADYLISKVPKTSSSFYSSNLYYDLSERLISSGRMIEALVYAEEAHRLRSTLFKEKFEYSMMIKTETFDEKGETIQKSYNGIQTFRVIDFAGKNGSSDDEGCVLTPWNVLSCYLESILQVGFIQEILGNVNEAEPLLRQGRDVAQFQGLPLFEITFSCVLGKLNRKQKHWNAAEKELSNAKTTLTDNLETISCRKCSCRFEVTINQELGELFLSSSCGIKKSPSSKGLLEAASFCKSALNKLNLFDGRASNSISESKIEPRRSKRRKKEVKPAPQSQNMARGNNRRITRSSHLSLPENHEIESGDIQAEPASGLAAEHLSTATDLDVVSVESQIFSADLQSDISLLCSNMKCLQCLHSEAVDCSNLNRFMCMNWALVFRKLRLRLLISIGKISEANDLEVNDILLQSISVLTSRYCSKHASDSVYLIETIGKQFPGDMLAVERAALLYYICWFNIKNSCPSTRKSCCELLCIGTEKIVSLLKLSFILSRDVPLLLQKISRLLAIIYVLSTSLKQFSLPPNEEKFESRWASFYHQASLGTQFNQKLLCDVVQKKRSDSEESSLLNSVSAMLDLPSSLRSAPESCKDLEEFVFKFFQGLPSSSVICISLVSGADAFLLRELLAFSPKVEAWILLSHLSSDNQHVIVLPVLDILEEVPDVSQLHRFCKDFAKEWECPWFSSVITEIAPAFRRILEANNYSSSESFSEAIGDGTSLWEERKKLDKCLSRFLQDMEDLWLGTWKYLLLGKWPDCNCLDSVQESFSKDDTDLLKLVVSKKCYSGRRRSKAKSKSSGDFENMMQDLFKSMPGMSENSKKVDIATKPIILVLDIDVQMLPWESLPILRNREVYRIPSIGSMFATFDRCAQNQENTETSVLVFPFIDPLDSYFLLNPDGDLIYIQNMFKNWFKYRNIEVKVKAGTVPTVEELSLALRRHDLFVYAGHGSGAQYIMKSEEYIMKSETAKLEDCAATLLLGCSSGCLYLQGRYMPKGMPLSCILAGSPVTVGNLWEVTDRDIGKFGKTILDAWLQERSKECVLCNNKSKCSHRSRMASFMGKARDACVLSSLNGAAPVCYGVPTVIINKKKKCIACDELITYTNTPYFESHCVVQNMMRVN